MCFGNKPKLHWNIGKPDKLPRRDIFGLDPKIHLSQSIKASFKNVFKRVRIVTENFVIIYLQANRDYSFNISISWFVS